MDIKELRKDFPLLDSDVIYFDNACSTLRPKQVIDAIQNYYEQYPVCPDRGVYRLSKELSEKCENVRQKVANFIGAQMADEIIFTKNTTEAINLVANSFDFKKGDIILLSDKEHNSNLLPWQRIAKEKCLAVKYVKSKNDNIFNLELFKQLLDEGNVKLVSFGLVSNLDGVLIPAKEIIKLSHKKNAYVFFDAAQAVPHQKINVSKLNADFLAFSGHKMLGPSGTGILYGKAHILNNLNLFMLGGATADNSFLDKDFIVSPVPQRFEPGIQNYAGIIGLGAAIDYLEKIGFEKIKEQEQKLNEIVTNEIKSIQNIKIIGPEDFAQRNGIISFYFDPQNVNNHGVAHLLSKYYNICVRSGRHCVHPWFNSHNIKGSLRASFYFYNIAEEARKFVDALKNIDLDKANNQPVRGCGI